MSDRELLDQLNETKEVKWHRGHLGVEAKIDERQVDAYVDRTFPLSLWNSLKYNRGLLIFHYQDVDLALLDAEFNQGHGATFTQVKSTLNLFSPEITGYELTEEELIVNTQELADSMSAEQEEIENYQSLNSELPGELFQTVRFNGFTVTIPMLYVPLFADYMESIFPLYYPTQTSVIWDQLVNTVVEDVVSAAYKSQGFVPEKFPSSRYGKRYEFSPSYLYFEGVYQSLLATYGPRVVKSLTIPGNFEKSISIDKSRLYDIMWKKQMTKLIESKDRLEELAERLGSTELAELVDQYFDESGLVYRQVFVKPKRLQRQREVTRYLPSRLASEVEAYLVPPVQPPSFLSEADRRHQLQANLVGPDLSRLISEYWDLTLSSS